jgi:hypothetical protein
VTEKEASLVIEALSAISFFPESPIARGIIAEEVGRLCPSLDDGSWLARIAVELHRTWDECGVKGLHQIWFSAHAPVNERERIQELASGSTPAYPLGIGRLSEPAPEIKSRPKKLNPAAAALKQIEAPPSDAITLPAPEVEKLHGDTVGMLLDAQPAVTPTYRDKLAARRFSAILDGNTDPDLADKLTAELQRLDPRTPEERRAIAEAEQQIAEAKPTRTPEEAKRQEDELREKLRQARGEEI